MLSNRDRRHVVALSVASQKREIGIRMAIGADRRSIARTVVGSLAGSVALGLGLGLAGSFVATRWIESLLWGVGPADPVALLLALSPPWAGEARAETIRYVLGEGSEIARICDTCEEDPPPERLRRIYVPTYRRRLADTNTSTSFELSELMPSATDCTT